MVAMSPSGCVDRGYPLLTGWFYVHQEPNPIGKEGKMKSDFPFLVAGKLAVVVEGMDQDIPWCIKSS